MLSFAELKDIKLPHVFHFTIGFISLVSPGFLTLFLFKPELIQSLDILKILTFSVSITLPIVCWNSFFASQMCMARKKDDQYIRKAMAITSPFMTALVIYCLLYLAYLTSWPFKTFTISVVVVELLLTILFVNITVRGNKLQNE